MDRYQDEIGSVFERLHRSLELVGERIVSLNRERELLIERIDEIELLNLDLESKLSQQSNVAADSSTRVEAFAEELESAKAEQARLNGEIQALQGALREKDELIAQQQGGLESYRLQVEKSEADQAQLAQLRLELAELEAALEDQKQGRGLQMEEWEQRIAEAEKERESVKANVEVLERERDQARATVESMIYRIQQLETSGNEANSSLLAEKEALARDLEEALELASIHEREAEELRHQLKAAQEERENSAGEFSVGEGERNELIEQVEHAISMIDKHLIDVE